MKFACLMFAYKDPEQLYRTIQALGDMDIYVHLDLKSDITLFKKSITQSNVKWVDNRAFVCWGGYSQVEALKSLMDSLIQSGKTYDRVIVITALDYPVLQSHSLEAYLSSSATKNYCTTMNLTKCNNAKELLKIQKYWFYDIKIRNYNLMRIVRKIIFCTMHFLYCIRVLKKKTTITVDNKEWDIYFGSESCCLTFDCFQYVYSTFCEKKEIEKYFKTAFAPIELITATIISNSPYKSTIEIIDSKDYKGLYSVSPLYYMEYDEMGGTGMKVLNEDDYEKIINSGKPFCRKVSSSISKKLEDIIDGLNELKS